MRYMGGKQRIAKHIAQHIMNTGNDVYIEPFVGGAAVLERITGFKHKIASDVSYDLIEFWRAIRDGWIPPDSISNAEYMHYKNNPYSISPELRAFAGYFCSFGGKLWGGYARSRTCNRDFVKEAKRAALKVAPLMQDVTFYGMGYSYVSLLVNDKTTVYCDPPYANTTGYKGTAFNSEVFWNKAIEWSNTGAIVLVSEYNCPVKHEVLWTKTVKTNLSTKSQGGLRTEKLFKVLPDM